MPTQSLFPTLVYTAPLGRGAAALNRELLRECAQIRAADAEGRRWSKANYPGGYTSYGSLCQLHRLSSTFATLEQHLARHARAFARQLRFDLPGQSLAMTDCWINVMPRGVSHGLHLHPVATLSGTYYLRTPAGTPGLKLEDPRLDRFMARPSRRGAATRATWHTVPARAGQLVLFESWLRHEVPVNQRASDRISVSFNFNWF
jgi:uncharacterized protein (TIGR02466 family)